MAQLGVAAVLGLASILISLVFWPGSFDADTVGELHEAATGQFTDWHDPVLEAFWRVPYLMGLHGFGWLLPIGLFTLLLGFYLLLRVRFSRPVSTLLALMCCVWPPVLTWAVHAGIDTWFAASIIAAFGFAARSARTTGRARGVSVAASVWFAFIAAEARHNALPAVLVLLVVLVAPFIRSDVRHKKVAACCLGILATGVIFVLGSGIQSAIGTKATHPIQGTYIYDLAQLSKDEHRVLIPKSIYPQQSLTPIVAYSTVFNEDRLEFGPTKTITFPVAGRQYDELRKAWESALRHDPLGYLKERIRLGLWMLSIGHPSYWLYNLPGPGPYSPKYPAANKQGYAYLSALTLTSNPEAGDWLYDVWIYAIILIVGAVVWWRRDRKRQALAGLAIAILIYTVVLEFSGPGELYRYEYPMVATGTVLAVILVTDIAGNISRVAARWVRELRHGHRRAHHFRWPQPAPRSAVVSRSGEDVRTGTESRL
jgi:hypothetical protein